MEASFGEADKGKEPQSANSGGNAGALQQKMVKEDERLDVGDGVAVVFRAGARQKRSPAGDCFEFVLQVDGKVGGGCRRDISWRFVRN